MQKTLVVVHDAGGAEIIAGYLRAKLRPGAYAAYAAGPAARIFAREGLAYRSAPRSPAGMARLMRAYPNTRLLTATGWMTDIEKDALWAAKRDGRKTIVYLESWNRYRERFGYPTKGWQSNLPDEIWVGDRDAEVLARKYFTRTHICFVANQYFKAIIARTKIARKTRAAPGTILFVSDAVPGAEQILEHFLSELEKREGPHRIRIRFHPADDRKRYNTVIRKHRSKFAIEKSSEPDIACDLAEARLVVGVETVALVAALLARKKTIVLPRKGATPFLPQKALLRPKTMGGAIRLITTP